MIPHRPPTTVTPASLFEESFTKKSASSRCWFEDVIVKWEAVKSENHTKFILMIPPPSHLGKLQRKNTLNIESFPNPHFRRIRKDLNITWSLEVNLSEPDQGMISWRQRLHCDCHGANTTTRRCVALKNEHCGHWWEMWRFTKIMKRYFTKRYRLSRSHSASFIIALPRSRAFASYPTSFPNLCHFP